MSRRDRLVARRLAIPLLGALVAAALVMDLAWSQTSNRLVSPRIAQAPLPEPALPAGQLPPPESSDPAPLSAEARFLPAEPNSDAPTSETIVPLEQEQIEDYTVPLRQPEGELALESEDGLISLVVRNASLQGVLAALAQTQGLNLITQETVTAKVNTTLHRMPFPDVLDVLLSTSGYTWVRNRNVIQVTSVTDSQNLAPQTQGRQVDVFQLDYVSATDVASVVQSMLSLAGSAHVILSSKTDNRKTQELLVVQDLPAYLEIVRGYIKKHDVPPRQVLIEAYILKVELSDDMRHGINFDHVFNMSNNLFQVQTLGLANSAATQGFMVNLSGGNLAAVVEMLETTTDAKTLAAPKIRVLNGQTARIQVGEQLGFRVTTTTQTSTLESVQFLEVGVVLEVTPRIGSDGTVIMRVSPEVSSGQVNPTTGLPEEKTTELQTDVMFHDNQAYVIGGLIQETDTDVQRKVPWLGSMKHVGHLFRRTEVVKRRSEVIVALLPRVMPFDPVTNDNLLLETDRALSPLLYGPLLEYPRPWEAQLPDVIKNPNVIRLPPITGATHGKGTFRVLPKSTLKPTEAADFAARETARREFGPPSDSMNERPVAGGAASTIRVSRLPPLDFKQPMDAGFNRLPPGTMLR